MVHPTVKKPPEACIKICLEFFCTLFPAGIDDVPIPLGDHLSLGMSRIPLHGLDVPAGQNQLISYTAVTQTVERHARKPQRKQLLFQHPREGLFL